MVLNPVNEDFEDYYSSINNELLNESTELYEMALPEVPGFGNSKYWVVSKDPDHLPLHAYVFSTSGEDLGDFLVREAPPKNLEDIKKYRKEIPENAKQMIVAQAGRRCPLNSKLSNWEMLTIACTMHIREKYRPN